MASQSLISAVNSYDNYIQRKGIDEQVIDAYIEACRVAINSEKDITYGLQITNRSKGIVERFCMERTGGTIWDIKNAYVVDEPKGEEQIEEGEYCKQTILGEDWYIGQYYWKMDNGKYLCMDFEI